MFGGSFPATGVLLEIGHLSFRLCYSGSDHSLLGEDAPKPADLFRSPGFASFCPFYFPTSHIPLLQHCEKDSTGQADLIECDPIYPPL